METLKNVSEWVNWLAMDADGQWWAYEYEPNQYHSGWYENELGRFEKFTHREAIPTIDWKLSLTRCIKD